MPTLVTYNGVRLRPRRTVSAGSARTNLVFATPMTATLWSQRLVQIGT